MGLSSYSGSKKVLGGRFRFLEGSVYPALRSLERDGLVRSYEGDPIPERRGRPRRYYELTAEGAEAARAQRQGLLGILEPLGAST